MKKTRRADFVMGLGFMAAAVCVFTLASDFLKVDRGIGPGDYPRVVAAGLFILGAILSVDSFVRGFPPIEEKFNFRAVLRLLVFIAASCAYLWLMSILGFNLVTPFFLFFGMYFFGYRKWLTMALVSVCVTAALYVIFRVIFLVMLPPFRLF
ncbi:MAG: tripartite tricarboxylate transporter TctB family protein [Spirochaetales bacterium]|jgi:putative tricarboxylic transport membrane protein|nr:tripartite tricarboxylate transporter TctB family protein [Spirochaetales bacterium]